MVAWRLSVTAPDGHVTPIVTGPFDVGCGLYDSNWVKRIVLVPPGGRLRVGTMDLSSFARAGARHRWLSGSLEARVEYQYNAIPSRPSQSEEAPPEVAKRFGALAGVAPFRMESNSVTVELVPPSVSADEIERELSLEIELENDGHFFAWELPRGRAWLGNVSSRSHRIVHPGFSGLGLCTPGHSLTGPLDCAESLELGPGERLEVSLASYMRYREWRAQKEHGLELVYAWGGRPGFWGGRPVPFDPENPDLPERCRAMADVPPFELRTRAFRIVMESPLIVELVPLAPVPSGRRYRLSEVLRLELRNEGEKPIELASQDAPLEVNLEAPDGWPHRFELSRMLVLPPHGELELTSDPELGIDAWSVNENSGAVRQDHGSASLQRKGWLQPVRSEPVKFELQ
ncbi:MAG: hypothetical protein HOP15_05360 [Planctomycetes bacterium]|nr:hypothetical protein [Planctomycetota bacterium]